MITRYYEELHNFIKQIKVRDKDGKDIELNSAVQRMIDIVLGQAAKGNKVMFIGNGGSAAIASHMAVDYWKNGGIRALAFNDAALLTCLSNDCGYVNVFGRAVEMFADQGDVLMAISSSGKSENILNGVKAAQKNGCLVVTLSGFSEGNALSKIGDLNFYVPSNMYSHVEIIHDSIIHYALDMIMEGKRGGQS